MLSVFMMSVVLPTIIIPIVIWPSVIMLNVVAPKDLLLYKWTFVGTKAELFNRYWNSHNTEPMLGSVLAHFLECFGETLVNFPTLV
jgi:hypothetical protein